MRTRPGRPAPPSLAVPRTAVGLRRALTLAAVLALALLVAPVGAGAERDGPLPRLDRVGPLEGDGARVLEDGGLQVVPAMAEVVVPPDRRVEVTHVVANTTDARLELTVDVADATPGPDGPAAGVTGPVPPDAEVQLIAPVERLVLDPGEGAEVVSTAQADAGATAVLALRAHTDAGDLAAGHVVVAADDVAADPRVEVRLGADGGTEVELRTARAAVVDVRVRSRSWAGPVSDRTVADVLVGPGGRVLQLDGPASRWPGPVRAVAVASAAGQEASAGTTRTTLPPASVALVVGALLLVALAVWRARRRRRAAAVEPPAA